MSAKRWKFGDGGELDEAAFHLILVGHQRTPPLHYLILILPCPNVESANAE